MNGRVASPTSNPLLDFSGLPRFGDIVPQHVGPAVDALLADARAVIEHVATSAGTPTWDGFVAPLAAAQDRLDRAWGQVAHLNATINSRALRDVYNANLPKVTAFHTEFGQDERLFAGFGALAANHDFPRLEPGQRRMIENDLRDFRLAGAELATRDKARFKGIEAELACLAARFEDNLLDATNEYALYIADVSDLAGVPEDVLASARAAAAAEGRSGWKLTLRMPCYQPVLQYADNRALRETLFRAHATRASEFGRPSWDNTSLIDRILRLRLEAARLLGYRNFAEVSLLPKMARTPGEVFAFLGDLAAKARPYAEREMAELRSLASAKYGCPELAAWDVPYMSEKLRQACYSFS